MASTKQQQQDAMASIDTAKALIDKVFMVLQLMESSPSLSVTFATNPIGFLLQILEHLGVKYEDLRLWITNFLIYVLPALEVSVKAILLTNLKSMISCSVDPRIPEKYRKRHKAPSDFDTSQEYGIDINIESIDFLNKLAVSPLSDEGSEMYFGLEGVTDVYKFARADDFDAFLWFVIHKGHFPNSAKITSMASFIDNIHGGGASGVSGDTLLEEVTVKYDGNSKSSILPGNTFTYAESPHVISMCIDSLYDKKGNNIVKNTLLPVSDDWNSVNWYARRADQLGKNIGFGWGVNQENANTKYKGKPRDYNKERALCNLQYLDQAQTQDSPLTGLVNNKLRFTILPKPYLHIPSISNGEPPWRFKKMLFDARGYYDPNGKYTFASDVEERIEGGKIYYGPSSNPYVSIDIKSGDVNVINQGELVKNLFECYGGLTVFEFNYDYVMSIKLFDAKVIATALLDSIVNTRVGVNATFGMQHQEATDTLKEIIKNIVNSDDSTVSDCFFTFDNSKYEALLRKSEEKRARQQRFGNVTEESSTFSNVQEILKEYSANAELHEQFEVLNRAITQASVNISEGVEEEDKFKVHLDFVTDLIEQLTFAVVSSLLSPKVLLLLEVNETIMGGKWEKFTMQDLITAMRSIIIAVIKEIRDLIVQELMKLVLKYLEPIISMLTSIILREQVENYTDAIMEILRNCPSMWFSLGNRFSDTKLDTVDYADIDASHTNMEEPQSNNC